MAGTVSQHHLSGNATMKVLRLLIARWPSRSAPLSIEGELRKHEYQREFAVGTQKSIVSQRVWASRVDSVLKLYRAARRESSDQNQEEAPRRGASPPTGLLGLRQWRSSPRWCAGPAAGNPQAAPSRLGDSQNGDLIVRGSTICHPIGFASPSSRRALPIKDLA